MQFVILTNDESFVLDLLPLYCFRGACPEESKVPPLSTVMNGLHKRCATLLESVAHSVFRNIIYLLFYYFSFHCEDGAFIDFVEIHAGREHAYINGVAAALQWLG